MATQNIFNSTLDHLLLLQNASVATPPTGGIFAVSTGDHPMYSNAVDVYGIPLMNNGGGVPSEGDMMIANSGDSFDLVSIGASGTVWTSDGTTGSWEAAPASPGLATFLCQTSSDLPTNGIDVSDQANLVVFGGVQADLPGAYQGSPFTIYNNTNRYLAQVLGDSNGSQDIWVTGFSGSDPFHCTLQVQGSGGSVASPAAVLNNDQIYVISVQGSFSTTLGDFSECSSLRFIAEGDFTSGTQHPAGIYFYTATAGDGGSVSRVKIGNTGLLTASYGISTTSLAMPTGAAGTVGTETALAAGPNTINTTAVTASSLVFVSVSTVAGAPTTATQVSCDTANNVAGMSFQIDVALGAGATSVDVNWFIVN